MRIAFITYEFPPDTGKGGIGTYVTQVAKAMEDFGWNVHVFAGSHTRSGSEQIENYWIHRIHCNTPPDFANQVVSVFEMEHEKNPFDLMESPEINGNAREIKKRFPGLPLIVRLHAPGYLVESLKKKYVPFSAKLRFVLGAFRRLKLDLGYWRAYNKAGDTDYQFTQLADYITAPSASMKQWAVKNWQIAPGKITVIPNIFSPPKSLLEISIPEDCVYKRVLFFGRLNVLKGLVNATKSMSKILNDYPDWKFRIIGDDGNGPHNGISMRSWMKYQLKKVMSQVEFLDGMDYDALPSAIGECEIVLLPSLFESFSYTCAEAMAAGKAVVGSKKGGMSDLLQNGQNGYIVDPENHRDMYVALKKIIDDNKFRYRLSVNARKRILTEFDANKTAIRINEYYHNSVC